MCLAIPGRVERIDNRGATTRSGKVRFGGIVREVNLAFVPEARAGDYVLVHVGFAISRIDEAEALRVLDLLRALEDPLEPAGEAS